MKKNRIHNINKTGFKTPKDYFNNLEDVILSEIKLHETFTESGFTAPKDYFDTLEERIINKVSKKETTKVIPLFSKRNIVYISSIAAAILLLFNLNIFNNEITIDNIDTQTVENYILDENIGTYEIASVLTDDYLLEESFIEFKVDDDAIETYILNDLDIENLIIE